MAISWISVQRVSGGPMICAYHALLTEFIGDCAANSVAAKVGQGFFERYGYLPGESERNSWDASLPAVAAVLANAGVHDADVFVEFQMPLSSARCDLLLVGIGADGKARVLVIELKQWGTVSLSAVRDTVSVLGRPETH
jgi:hypothetical protein